MLSVPDPVKLILAPDDSVTDSPTMTLPVVTPMLIACPVTPSPNKRAPLTVSDWAPTLMVCVILLLQLPAILPTVVREPPALMLSVAACTLPNNSPLALAPEEMTG